MKKYLRYVHFFAVALLVFSGCSRIKEIAGGADDFFSKDPSKGALKVLISTPSTAEMPISTEGVTVMFDRPMVPLTTLDAGREKIPPLTIDPPVQGKYYWLGTKGFIYRFKEPLKTATTYRVKLPEGVTALDGYKLEKALEWNFSTVRPKLRSVSPSSGKVAPKRSVIQLHFNVAMNRADVEGKLSLVQSSTNKPLAARRKFAWEENDHVLRILFEDELPWNEKFALTLPAGALGKDGSLGTVEEVVHDFETPSSETSITKVFYYGPSSMQVEIEPDKETPLNAGTGICFEFSQSIDSKTFDDAFYAEGEENFKQKPFSYFRDYDYIYIQDNEDGSDYLEGYRVACVALLEEFNTLYKFSIDTSKLKTPVGAIVQPFTNRYIVKTGHAEPDLNSKLTRNILSQKGSLKIPYKAINIKSVTANLYRLAGPDYYSERVQNHKALSPKKIFDETTRTWSEVVPRVSESFESTELEVPLRGDTNLIDQSLMPALGSLDIPVSETPDAWNRFLVNLDDFSGEVNLAPGFYLVETIPVSLLDPNQSADPVYSMVQVTSVALALKREPDQILAWATDIESGQPIDALPLNITYIRPDGTVIEAAGTTSGDGVAVFKGEWSTDEYDYSETACVESTLPEKYSYSCQSDHNLTGYRDVLSPGEKHFAYIYTDRPIYRPGQTVYFSAFVRRVREGRYFLVDEGTKYNVTVSDASGENIYSREETAEAGGVIRGSFELDDRNDLPRGNYDIRVSVGGEQAFSRMFFVQSYRKPSFKVDMKTAKPEIASGQELAMTVQGAYFFGAPMKKAKTSWSIMTTTYDFSPEGFEDFTFLDADLLYRRSDEGYYGEYYDDYDSEYEYDYVAGYPVSEEESQWDDPRGEGVFRSSGSFFKNSDNKTESGFKNALDDAGELVIKYSPNLTNYPFSQVLTVEANVMDPSYQEVSAADEVVVHKADYYVGLKPQKWAYGEKETAVFDIVSLNTEGKPAGNRSFEAEFFRREYNYIKRRNARGYWEFVYEHQDVPVEKKSAATDAGGKTALQFVIPKGGTYRVVIKAKDDRGNAIQSANEIYAWGEGYVPWRLNEAQDIELVPDKDSYQIGETAKILVKTLLPVTKALVTYERGHVLQYEVKDLGGNATHIEIPVTEGMIPNFYLDVIAHVGRDGDRPPLVYHGETELAVSPESKRLKIAIKTDREGTPDQPAVYAPGDEVTVRLAVTDPQGRPLKSHVMVSVADEAVLRLLDYQLPDLVKKFYFRRPNQVRSSSSMLSFKAGDGSADKKKRRIFQDTAHFEGHIVTDANGEAEFRFKLPDDLTTWVIEALAVSDSKSFAAFESENSAAAPEGSTPGQDLRAAMALTDGTFVGGARGKIMSTIPVVMRAALPRFVAWEDLVKGRVLLNNRNKQNVAGKLRMSVSDGVAFEGGQKSVEVPFEVKAGEEKAFPVAFKVDGRPESVAFSVEALAQDGSVVDALEISLPAIDRLAAEVVASSGVVRDDKETEQVDLSTESGINPQRGGMDISFKASLGLAVADPMRRLIYYPYGCSEQKSATLIAMLLARDLSAKFGEKYFDSLAPLSAKEIKNAGDLNGKLALLDGKINGIIDELRKNYQSYWGGMKYWPESQTDSFFASAQVLWAFTLARNLGFAVDRTSEANLQNYLWKEIGKGDAAITYYDPFASWVIAKSGWTLPLAAINRTLTRKDQLSSEDIAFLLLALAETERRGDQDEAARSLSQAKAVLMDRLLSLSRQEPRHTSWGAYAGATMPSVKHTALAAHGLYSIDANHPIPSRALAYLLNRKKGKNQYFYSTQEDLYLSYFAYEYALRMGEQNTNYQAVFALDQNVLLQHSFNKDNVLEEFRGQVPMEKLMANKPLPMMFDKKGEGTLYYDSVLKYYLPAGKAPPREEGLMITREYYSLDDAGEEKPLITFKVGEVYKGHIIITVPEGMNYVMIQDLLPAGLEPVDMTLATTSRALANLVDGDEDRSYEEPAYYDDEFIVEDYGSDYGFSHQEIRDDSILWSDEYVPAGVYHLRYPVRATTAGTYLSPGAEAFEFYEPEIFGRSRAMMVTVEAEQP